MMDAPLVIVGSLVCAGVFAYLLGIALEAITRVCG